MLPVSSWPPGPPGASLSPFARPRPVKVGDHGFVIPKGKWIVSTSSANSVVMFSPPVSNDNPARSPGTGLLPGTGLPPPPTPTPHQCPPNVFRPTFRRFNDVVEWSRARQRELGRTDFPIKPFPGHRPPNWYGWLFIDAPAATLVPSNASGLVLADGQNIVIIGTGCATITQAF